MCQCADASHPHLEGDAAKSEIYRKGGKKAIQAKIAKPQHKKHENTGRDQHGVAHVTALRRADEDTVHLEGKETNRRQKRRPVPVFERQSGELGLRCQRADDQRSAGPD